MSKFPIKTFITISLLLLFLIFFLNHLYFEVSVSSPLDSKAYLYARENVGRYGGICYQFANYMKRKFPEVESEHVLVSLLDGRVALTHYRVKVFENSNFIIFAESNWGGHQLIRLSYQFK